MSERRRRMRRDKSKLNVARLVRWFFLLAILLTLVLFIVEFRPVSSTLFEIMPDIVSRVRHPIFITVDKVTVMNRYHGIRPSEGNKFVMVYLKINCRFKVAYPIVRECFQLADSDGGVHIPLSNSPLFIEKGGEFGEFYMDTGDEFEGRLVYEIPSGTKAESLHFDRAREREEEIKAALGGQGNGNL